MEQNDKRDVVTGRCIKVNPLNKARLKYGELDAYMLGEDGAGCDGDN